MKRWCGGNFKRENAGIARVTKYGRCARGNVKYNKIGRKSSTVLVQTNFADNRFPVWRHSRQKRKRRRFIHKRALACRDVTVIRPASDTNRWVQSNRDSNNNNQSVVRRVLHEMKVILRCVFTSLRRVLSHFYWNKNNNDSSERKKIIICTTWVLSMKHRVGSGAINTNRPKCKWYSCR